METKRVKPMKRVTSNSDFEVKANSPAKAVTLQGLANKAVVDRGNDLIPVEEWSFEDFNKLNNPVLFNHNPDIPIGTAEVKTVEEGLFADVKISRSNEAPIPFIRDLIKEGILKTFSVGFETKEKPETRQEDGVRVLKGANLLELSVVTIPMNKESTFSVVNKASSGWKTKSYHECRKEVLNMKGAFLAESIHDSIETLKAKNPDLDRDDFLSKLFEDSSLEEQKFNAILSGDDNEVSEEFLKLLSDGLEVPMEDLMKVAKIVPDAEKSEEPAVKEEPKSEEKDFNQLVTEKISELLNDGMEKDQAIAESILAVGEGKNSDISTEDYLKFLAHADAEVSKLKQIQEEKQEDLNNPEVTQNADATNEAVENTQVSNPSMDQFKAQTTLLGQINGSLSTLVQEIRGLRIDLQNEKAIAQSLAGQTVEDQEEEAKALDIKRKRREQLSKKLDMIEKQLSL